MVNDKRYFFLASLFSFFLFSVLLFSFVFFLFHREKIQTYGMEKKQYISISLNTIPTHHKSIKKRQSKKNISKKQNKIHKNSVVDPLDVEDVADLFDSVHTKKVITKKIKRIDRKKIAQIAKSVDIDINKDLQSNEDLFSKEKKQQNSIASSYVVNKYLAKIHAIVYNYFYPPQNTQGLSVRVVITLSPLGRMLDFKILDYSPSSALNQEVENLKNRLKSVIFPKNPQNKSQRITIILKPEDKE